MQAMRRVVAEERDRARFEGLYRTYAAEVLAYALRRAPADVAHDATPADVAWRRMDAVPRDRPLPWLLAVARKVLATQRRTARRQAAVAAKLARAPRADPHADAGHELVLAALRRLPEREREALMLTAWEDLDSAAAARALGCSAVAFRLRLYRARKRLARVLETEQEGVRLGLAELSAREVRG
jgi:RNA polymerase sigma-70 factor, ECF subfamily